MAATKQPNTTVRLQPPAFEALNLLAEEHGASLSALLTRLLLWALSQPRSVRRSVLGVADPDEAADAAHVARFGNALRAAQQASLLEAAVPFVRRIDPSTDPLLSLVGPEEWDFLLGIVELVPPTRSSGRLARLLISLNYNESTRQFEIREVEPDWATDPEKIRALAASMFGDHSMSGRDVVEALIHEVGVELKRLWGIVDRDAAVRGIEAVVATAQLKHLVGQVGALAKDAPPFAVIELASFLHRIRQLARARDQTQTIADAIDQALPDALLRDAWVSIGSAAGGPEHGAIPEAAGRDGPSARGAKAGARSIGKSSAKPAPGTNPAKADEPSPRRKAEKRPKR